MKLDAAIAMACAGALVGCASTGVAAKSDLMRVQPGMSREAVVGLLGEPGNRTFRGSGEALQYCKKQGLIADFDEYTTIWLSGGAVAGLTTETRRIAFSSCDRYPAIDWGQIPPNIRVKVE